MSVLSKIVWAGIGALLVYLFDPNSGRRRRTRLRDQGLAELRDLRRTAGKKARYGAGKVKGMVYEMISSDEPPANDAELLQKIRSEAVGTFVGPIDHVDVRVHSGTVTLVGESRDSEAEKDLMERIRRVTGVRQVRNELAAS